MTMIKIDNLDIEALKVYTSLTESQLFSRNLFIAESKCVIVIAIQNGYEPVSLLIEDKEIESDDGKEIFDCIGDIDIYYGTKEVLSQLTGYNLTCGFLCCFKRKEIQSVNDLIKAAKRIVILENVTNSMNVGSIFRNAAAFGFDCVLLTEDSADPLYRRSIRVSMGNVFNIKYGFIEDIHTVKQYGFKTVGMALRKNTIDIDDPSLKKEEKLAIVLGCEGYGLKDHTIDDCDYVVKIPMYNNVDSLNVSSASAIALWELS